MNQAIHMQERTGEQHAGMRLDQAAAELFPDYSRARLQLWIRQGNLTVDGAAGRPAQRLAGGELLTLDATPEPAEAVEAQALPLNVIFADPQLLVIDKAAGMVVHPAAGNPDGTLQNALLHFDPGLAQVPRAGIVHRLDKDTSGVLVIARSLPAHAALVAQLQDRSMSRTYETLVHGHAPGQGTVDAAIGRHPRDRQRMAVVARGKPAVTHYRALRHFRHFTHLEVSLESGRTHQIRVHMQHIGHPLVGDPVYGRKLRKAAGLAEPVLEAVQRFGRQALHARRLALRHPASGERCVFESPLPADLEALLEVLARHDA